MNIPSDLLYSNDHEWVRLEEDIATIGITDFAQQELGDIVYIDETIGDNLQKEQVFGTVEAVKTVSDLFMPISGEVIEFNTALEDTPETVNNEPYESGWIIKIKIENPSQLKHLLSTEQYNQLIQA